MKTIKEFTKESVNKIKGIESKGIAYYSIKAGIEFAQRWIPIEEELPLTYEKGDWDGERSDFVLIKLANGNWHKARLYTGVIDGHKYNDFCSENDYVFSNVTHWRLIELE